MKIANPKDILVVISMILAVVLLTSGGINIAKNSRLGLAGLFDSIGNIVTGHKKPTSKVSSGRVVEINGNIITVQGTITTTYKIDVSGIKIAKNSDQGSKNISASDMKKGDVVQIYGSASDYPLSADSITVGGSSLNSFLRISNLENFSNLHSSTGTVGANQPIPPNLQNLLKNIKAK